MVTNLAIMKDEFSEGPDIFRAAENNDVDELRLALSEGQSLNDVQTGSGFSPIHIAIIRESTDFLDIAMSMDFDPWIRDLNLRLAFDHAAAWRMKNVMRSLHTKMYPNSMLATPSAAP